MEVEVAFHLGFGLLEIFVPLGGEELEYSRLDELSLLKLFDADQAFVVLLV